jgi:hypothetical protein
MNIKQVAASIAALTILAGGPAIALADNSLPSDPIAISNVNLQTNDGSDGFGTGFVSVDFQNTSHVDATEVAFELDVNGARVSRFNDIGSFEPGVTVKHAFLNTSSNANAQLNIVKVKFADGSVWVPANMPTEVDS